MIGETILVNRSMERENQTKQSKAASLLRSIAGISVHMTNTATIEKLAAKQDELVKLNDTIRQAQRERLRLLREMAQDMFLP